jgi:hypothetical protein
MREPVVLAERAPNLTSDHRRTPVVPAVVPEVKSVCDSPGETLATDYPAVFVLVGGVLERRSSPGLRGR